MGDLHNNDGYRLQFARKPPRFSGVISSHTEGNSAYNLKDEISGCGLRGAPTLEQTPVLLPVFSGPQEGRCSPSYLGSKSVEQTFEEMRKYNFRMLTHRSLLRSIKNNNWFTSVDLKDAFFHKHLSSPQKIPSFRLPRHVLRVPSPSIWALPQSKDFLSVHGGGFEPAKNSGSQDPTCIDNWLIIANSRGT